VEIEGKEEVDRIISGFGKLTGFAAFAGVLAAKGPPVPTRTS
jgi:hypothetical protein